MKMKQFSERIQFIQADVSATKQEICIFMVWICDDTKSILFQL